MAEPTYPHNIGKEYVWWTERGQVAVGYIDRSITPVSDDGVVDESVKVLSPHEVTTVRLYVTKRAETAPGSGQFESTGPSETPEFPVQFHEALVFFTIMRGYERDARTIPLAEYWMRRYIDVCKDGKRWADSNNVYGFKKITQPPVYRI
jgi:hypothetical protein